MKRIGQLVVTIKYVFIFLISTPMVYALDNVAKVNIATTDLIPWYYTDRDGQLSGMTYDMVNLIFSDLGIPHFFTTVPIGRIMREGGATRNFYTWVTECQLRYQTHTFLPLLVANK